MLPVRAQFYLPISGWDPSGLWLKGASTTAAGHAAGVWSSATRVWRHLPSSLLKWDWPVPCTVMHCTLLCLSRNSHMGRLHGLEVSLLESRPPDKSVLKETKKLKYE